MKDRLHFHLQAVFHNSRLSVGERFFRTGIPYIYIFNSKIRNFCSVDSRRFRCCPSARRIKGICRGLY